MTRRPLTTATVELFIGHKGMGKSAAMAAASAESSRLFIWDWMREHGNDVEFTVRSAGEACELITALGTMPASVRWLPRLVGGRADFENFCLAAMAWGEQMPGQESVSVCVEELAAVTGSAKAADLWGGVTRECRHWHLKVYATAQRTAEIDKTVLGGISRICVFWMPLQIDRARAADDLQIPQEHFDAIAGRPLRFIETDATGRWCHGQLRFAK